MNQGFKGTIVNIGGLSIESKPSIGVVVNYRAFFDDAEGITHAHMNHTIAVEQGTALHEHVKGLLDACRAHAQQTHFKEPADATTNRIPRVGIAESLQDEADQSGGPGEQG